MSITVFFSGDRSEPVSAEISFYSRGGSVPCSLKAQVTATYVTNSGELNLKKRRSLIGCQFENAVERYLSEIQTEMTSKIRVAFMIG